MNSFSTRTEAIAQIVAAIEANGADIAAADQYDIDGIAADVIEVEDGRYSIDQDAFWASVERHAK